MIFANSVFLCACLNCTETKLVLCCAAEVFSSSCKLGGAYSPLGIP